MKFYLHAGSMNHGCEAIVRSTVQMTNHDIVLFSEHPDEDLRVGLNEICKVDIQGGRRSKSNPIFIACKIVEVLFGNSNLKYWYAYKNVIESADKGDLYISIGGDNYCYNANPYLIYLNDTLNKRGAKTGLWGCSIEPESLKDPKLVDDMKKYSFISARETITFDALKNAGLNNIYLYPDPAFTLEMVECKLPAQFSSCDVVGLNLSPLVQKLDNSGNIVLDNYVQLVRTILKDTNMSIALIPHVCKPENDDRKSMEVLASFFPNEKRIFMVNQEGIMDCRKLKYIISKCRFMVTARTHASIAAYSSCVPTLVVGYSIKARGIARDILGTFEGYVADIHEMRESGVIASMFRDICYNEKDIQTKLKNTMPGYIEKAKEASVLLI